MERELEYWAPGATEQRAIRVRFGVPEPHPKHDWACEVSIVGFEEPYSRWMYGSDSVAAMAAALAIAPFLLRTFVARGGRLVWQGRTELDFPVLFSQPEHTCQFSPADGTAARKVSVRVNHPEQIGESWSVLVSVTDHTTWERIEKRRHGETWAKALERAAAAVPDLLQEYVDKGGGGVLEEGNEGPACRISDAE